MFSDMAGSSALAERLDPEDLREVIRAFQDACVRAIARFDGSAAKFMGDGVLAYFGYPLAHEDDAERAVRAGLTVVEEVAGLTLQGAVRLEVRVGIATGLVVVGQTVGEGEEVVIGETPNLAARLQGIAEMNAVVISESTRQLLGGRFDLEDLGRQFLKGMASPVPCWRVLGEDAAESRFEAGHARRATRLFGRDREVGLMMDCWARAVGDEGRAVLLSGEAGIGKSRVVEALRQKIGDAPHTRIQCQCSPHHTNSPLYPVIAQLERAAGFAQDDTAGIKLDKLERLLMQSSSDIDLVAPLFATLLSLPFDGRYPALELTPSDQKQRTLSALIDHLDGLAKQRPVLFVLEDAHWIDPTTLELFARTIDQLQHWPVLLIVTLRPGFDLFANATASHVTALTLDRLEQGDVVAMIDSLTGGKWLPADVRDEIVAKTDGVPLFVEELTKAVLGSGLVEEAADRYVLRGPQAPLAIPETLHDSLLARLDHLGLAREIAQLSAVIGREFSFELLDAVAPMHGKALGDGLGQLARAGLILARGVPPKATYVFKHALVQDAAYGSLLRSTRRQLHGRIARAITQLTPQIAETQPELLAHHYGQARLVDDAVAFGLKAGRSAARRSANEEAITHCTRALELLSTKPAGTERDRQELELLVALGVPTFAARGYMSADVERIYERARGLCDDVTDTPHRFTVLRGLWNSAFMRKPLALSQNLGAELLALANAQDDDTRRALACRAHGCSLFFRGEFGSAWQRFREAVDLWPSGKARAEFLVYGEDLERALPCLRIVALVVPRLSRGVGCVDRPGVGRCPGAGPALHLCHDARPRFGAARSSWRSPAGIGARRCIVDSQHQARLPAMDRVRPDVQGLGACGPRRSRCRHRRDGARMGRLAGAGLPAREGSRHCPVGGGVRENGAHCGGPRLARGRRGACPHVPGMLPRGRAPSDTRRTAARAGDTAGGGGLSSSLHGNRSPPEGEIA